ncbi:MAG TPA: endonuclease III [Humisphaera sp.]|jgi:endonuclease-3|nr:endonuclease III [Humisphaera sp.]
MIDVRKEPFVISIAMRRLRAAVKDYPKAAMFELADEGFTSLFEQLISCIISIRTFEHVTLATARRLFAVARTPEQIAGLSVQRIDQLIGACTFHRPKAQQLHVLAQTAMKKYQGNLPQDRETLLQLPGVGPKCANLALGVSSGKPVGIPVDIHVHRVVNRWGIVAAKAPEQTMETLQTKLPRRYWLEINKLLVPFGKHICRGVKPRCPTCPLLSMCRQVGVTETAA